MRSNIYINKQKDAYNGAEYEKSLVTDEVPIYLTYSNVVRIF